MKSTASLPPGDFRLLIAAINRGAENEIVDEAGRLARVVVAKRRKRNSKSRASGRWP